MFRIPQAVWNPRYTKRTLLADFSGMEALAASLTLEQAEHWCYKNAGACSYVNEEAALASLDEELWGKAPDASDAQWEADCQRLRDVEEFNR